LPLEISATDMLLKRWLGSVERSSLKTAGTGENLLV